MSTIFPLLNKEIISVIVIREKVKVKACIYQKTQTINMNFRIDKVSLKKIVCSLKKVDRKYINAQISRDMTLTKHKMSL